MRISGELVVDTVANFRTIVSQSMREDDRDYVIDLSEALRIDSVGLEALLWLGRSCEEKLGAVKLAGCSATIETILKMTRIDTSFERYPDVKSAVASFG